jgi:hypothetical protein
MVRNSALQVLGKFVATRIKRKSQVDTGKRICGVFNATSRLSAEGGAGSMCLIICYMKIPDKVVFYTFYF